MAIDLYMREVDNLRFELSMNQCSPSLSSLAQDIIDKSMFMFSSTVPYEDILVTSLTTS